MKDKKNNFTNTFVGLIAFLLVCILITSIFVSPPKNNSSSSNIDNSTSIDGDNSGSNNSSGNTGSNDDGNSSSNNGNNTGSGNENNSGSSSSGSNIDVSSDYLFSFYFLCEENVIDSAEYIWTDGNYTYYSYGNVQYIFDKDTFSWVECTWRFFDVPLSFNASAVWTDGEDYYIGPYFSNFSFYKLDKETLSWYFINVSYEDVYDLYYIQCPEYFWTDGENVYSSFYNYQFVFNKSNSKWEIMNWDEEYVPSFSGEDIWTDGRYIYLDCSYIFNPSTLTFEPFIISGITDFNAKNVWTYKNYTFYSDGENHYILDKSTFDYTWKTINFGSLLNFSAENVWSVENNVYITVNSKTYFFGFDKKVS